MFAILKKMIWKILFYHESPDYWWKLRNIANKNKIASSIGLLLYNSLINRYNSFIPLSVEFLNKPCFPHGIRGIFISGGAKIGSNCVIFHHVTIGSNTLVDSKKAGAPTVGNNVYIGCGAKIIGNVKIGNNVRIGANCVVCEDIPDNSTVVLEKCRIIAKKNKQNNTFVEFKF